MTCRARGNQGNWFAKVTATRHPEIDGLDLPCIWDFWSTGDRYCDKGYQAENPKFAKLVEGLKTHGYAVMRKRARTDDPNEWKASGYIAIFQIADVEAGSTLNFRFVRRVCDLEN